MLNVKVKKTTCRFTRLVNSAFEALLYSVEKYTNKITNVTHLQFKRKPLSK